MAQLEGVGRVGWRNSVNVTGFTLNPDFAYSFRKVISTATLSCRVRRSSDNTEQNIGFVGNDLDNAALSAFVGAGNGFVVKIYDQKGSGNDLVQTTASSQFQIVNAGSIYTLNGKTTCLTTTTQYLSTGFNLFNFNNTTGISVFSVNQLVSAYNILGNFAYSLGDGSSSGNNRIIESTIHKSTDKWGNTTPTFYNSNIQPIGDIISQAYTSGVKIQTHLAKNGEHKFLINNSTIGTTTPSLDSITNPLRLVVNGAAFSVPNSQILCNQYFSEILIYNSYQNTAINDIHANINSYYSIY